MFFFRVPRITTPFGGGGGGGFKFDFLIMDL